MICYINTQEEGLTDAQLAVETDSGPDSTSIAALKSTLDSVSNACAAYVRYMINAPALGNTKLDRERQKMCLHEIVSYNAVLSYKRLIGDFILDILFSHIDFVSHRST